MFDFFKVFCVEFVDAMLDWSAKRVAEKHSDLAGLLQKVQVPDEVEPRRLVFRHGDLSVDNILICADGRLCFIDWEWAGVYDERDVWLEMKELLVALKMEKMLQQGTNISPKELLEFDRLKEVFMGVAWAEAMQSEDEREEELEYLRENLASYT